MTSKWVPTTNLLHLRRFGKSLEEVNELGAVLARCIVQGIDEIDPASGKTNRQRLEEELADVQAQIVCTTHDLGLNQDLMQERMHRKIGYMRDWESVFKA